MAEDKKNHSAAPANPAVPAAQLKVATPQPQAKGGGAAPVHAGAAPAHQGGQAAHAGAGRDLRARGPGFDSPREKAGFPAGQLFRPVAGPGRPWYFAMPPVHITPTSRVARRHGGRSLSGIDSSLPFPARDRLFGRAPLAKGWIVRTFTRVRRRRHPARFPRAHSGRSADAGDLDGRDRRAIRVLLVC